MSKRYDDYDVAMRSLRKKGIHESKVDFCPVSQGPDGVVIFHVRRKVGAIAQWVAIPIRHAQREDLGLIGFVFPDGTMRADAEILCSKMTGKIHIPIFVCFWKPGIPLRDRNFVADGKMSRASEKPTIIVP